jgi:uncharacterized protein with ACT and thioredoxin-like domain
VRVSQGQQARLAQQDQWELPVAPEEQVAQVLQDLSALQVPQVLVLPGSLVQPAPPVRPELA